MSQHVDPLIERDPTAPIGKTFLLATAFLAALTLPGCEPEEQLREDGVRIQQIAEGSGPEPAPGQWVALEYAARFPGNDRCFDRSVDGEYYVFPWGDPTLIQGLRIGLEGLRPGGRRRIHIPADQAYGTLGKGAVPPDQDLLYEVTLRQVFEVTPSGLQLREVQPAPEGARPTPGQVVILDYRGILHSTGREFASSRSGGKPLEFALGSGVALAGIDEGVARMTVGSRFQFVLPPTLAYGERGVPPSIPGGEPLLFDCTLRGLRAGTGD